MGAQQSLFGCFHKQVRSVNLNRVCHVNDVFSLYGDYRFSSMEMPRHPSRDPKNNRLSAEDMQFYFEKFTETYLRDRISYETEVLNIRRPQPPFDSDPPNWIVKYRKKGSKGTREMGFHRIILCTGVRSALFA